MKSSMMTTTTSVFVHIAWREIFATNVEKVARSCGISVAVKRLRSHFVFVTQSSRTHSLSVLFSFTLLLTRLFVLGKHFYLLKEESLDLARLTRSSVEACKVDCVRSGSVSRDLFSRKRAWFSS